MKTEENNRRTNGEKLIRLLMLTLILSSMSAQMFNIALPKIGEQFDLAMAQVSWLSSAYILIYAIGTVTYGRLADKYRLKNLLTFGLLLFAAGSLLGLFAQTFGMALAGRCLQAAGASAIPATAMMIPVRYFAPERRGYALGMTATGLALGNTLGPVVSALITGYVHWRWLFAVPLLLLATLPFYRKYLENEQTKSGGIDWIGGGLLAAAVALLLLGVTEGAWPYFGFGLLAAALFAARIRHAAQPFVDPSLLKNKAYASGLAMAFVITGALSSVYFLSPLLLADVQRLPSAWIGFAMVPAAATAALLGRKAGRLADRKGNAHLFFLASALLLFCFLSLSTFTAAAAAWIALFLVFGNVGQSFMSIALSNSISRTLPKERAGVGMGLFSMLNFMSQAIAAGIYGRAIDAGAAASWNPANASGRGFVFSNIYLVLAVLLLAVLAVYYFRQIRTRSADVGLGH